jgi:hypothetical protein
LALCFMSARKLFIRSISSRACGGTYMNKLLKVLRAWTRRGTFALHALRPSREPSKKEAEPDR